MSGDIEFTFTIDEASKDVLKELFDFDKEITKKIVDIYNYMAEKRTSDMYLQFGSGTKINISIDTSQYRGRVGNPDKTESEGQE